MKAKKIPAIILALMLFVTVLPFPAMAADSWVRDEHLPVVDGILEMNSIVQAGKEAVSLIEVETEGHNYAVVFARQKGADKHTAVEVYIDGDEKYLIGNEVDSETNTHFHWFSPINSYVVKVDQNSTPYLYRGVIELLFELGFLDEEAKSLLETVDIEGLEQSYKGSNLLDFIQALKAANIGCDAVNYADIPYLDKAQGVTVGCLTVKVEDVPLFFSAVDKIVLSGSSIVPYENLLSCLSKAIGELGGEVEIYNFAQEGKPDTFCYKVVFPVITPAGEKRTYTFVIYADKKWISKGGNIYLSLTEEKETNNGRKVLEADLANSPEDGMMLHTEVNTEKARIMLNFDENCEMKISDGDTVKAERIHFEVEPGLVSDSLNGNLLIACTENKERERKYEARIQHSEGFMAEAEVRSTIYVREPESLIQAADEDILSYNGMPQEDVAQLLMNSLVDFVFEGVDIFSESSGIADLPYDKLYSNYKEFFTGKAKAVEK